VGGRRLKVTTPDAITNEATQMHSAEAPHTDPAREEAHTPKPWSVEGYMVCSEELYIADTRFSGLPIEEAKANAEFICRAVNNHDALLNALQTALNALRSYQYGNASTELAESVADHVAAAIAAATEGATK
jgi:hypothetical protein